MRWGITHTDFSPAVPTILSQFSLFLLLCISFKYWGSQEIYLWPPLFPVWFLPHLWLHYKTDNSQSHVDRAWSPYFPPSTGMLPRHLKFSMLKIEQLFSPWHLPLPLSLSLNLSYSCVPYLGHWITCLLVPQIFILGIISDLSSALTALLFSLHFIASLAYIFLIHVTSQLDPPAIFQRVPLSFLIPSSPPPHPVCSQTDLILCPEPGGWLTCFRRKPFAQC